MSDTEVPGSKDAPTDPSRKPAPRRRKPAAKAAKQAQPQTQPQTEHAPAAGAAVAAKADQPTVERASREGTPMAVAKPKVVAKPHTPVAPAADPSTAAKKPARSRRKPRLAGTEAEVKQPEPAVAPIVNPVASPAVAATADAVSGTPTTEAALRQEVHLSSAPANEAVRQPAEAPDPKTAFETHYSDSDSDPDANAARAEPSGPPLASASLAAPIAPAPHKPRQATAERADAGRGSPVPPPATPTSPAGKPSHSAPARAASPGAMPAGRPLISTPMSVRWRDLDAFNHVNNSKYLIYLEEARLQWMLGIPGLGIDDHVAPVVAASQLNYRRPITWPSQLVIELFVERLGNTSVTIGHRIVDANQADVLYCDGNVVMVWIDRDSGQAAALPRDVRRLCSP